MLYSFEQVVTLKSSRGGWRGVVSQQPSYGPQGPEYPITPLDLYASDRGIVNVRESDIESGTFDVYPNWSVGDTVVLYQNSGTITAIDGNLFTVEVDHVKKHYTITRTHNVQRWRLLIENN